MSAYYISLFIRDSKGKYAVFFPDFPEIASCGEDIDDAMKMARDALKIAVEEYTKENRKLPKPSDMNAVKQWEQKLCEGEDMSQSESMYPMFPCPNVDTRSVKITLSIPICALNALDRKARELGLTRSGCVAQYAMQ